MKLVNDNTGTMKIILKEPLCRTQIKILLTKKEEICFHTQYGDVKLTDSQFSRLCRMVEKILNKLVKAEKFECRNFQPKYLAFWLSKNLQAFDREEIDYVYLDELMVSEDNGNVNLRESDKFQALKGQIDIDQKKQRISNGIGQINSSRLNDNLGEVRHRGYPFHEEYIILYNSDIVIKDGAHRAACLYYLYGNIRIPVKRIYFCWERLFGRGFVFPFEKVRKCERIKGAVKIVLYGAGHVGRIFSQQVRRSEGSVQMVLWVDQAYAEINLSEVAAPTQISQTEYDYIVIALEKKEIAEDIKETLILMGIAEEKIIWENYYKE